MPSDAVRCFVDFVDAVDGDGQVHQGAAGLVHAPVRIEIDVTDRFNHPVT